MERGSQPLCQKCCRQEHLAESLQASLSIHCRHLPGYAPQSFLPRLRPAAGKGDKIGKKMARREKIRKRRDPTSRIGIAKIGWRKHMLRDHFISVLAAAYAISLARGVIRADSQGSAHYGLLDFLARRMRIGN